MTYINASRLAEEVSVTITKPRNISSMKHLDNAPSDTLEEYYRRNMFLPFLNHITVNFKDKIKSHGSLMVSLEKIIPEKCVN